MRKEILKTLTFTSDIPHCPDAISLWLEKLKWDHLAEYLPRIVELRRDNLLVLWGFADDGGRVYLGSPGFYYGSNECKLLIDLYLLYWKEIGALPEYPSERSRIADFK